MPGRYRATSTPAASNAASQAALTASHPPRTVGRSPHLRGHQMTSYRPL